MRTIIEKAGKGLNTEDIIDRAAHILRNGGLVAFPTETVYGLGANAYDSAAAKKIYEAKGRPSDNPLIIHINGYEMLEDVCGEISDTLMVLAKSFWPGPLTLITKKSRKIPKEATGGLETVAVRLPDNKTALSLIDKCGFPLAGPSANASGKPSPTRASHVEYDLSGKIDMIIDGGPCRIGLESTIVDVTRERPVILRPGHISESDIRNALGCKLLNGSITRITDDGGSPPMSPGTKYRHYSPKAELTIVLGEERAVAAKIESLIIAAEERGKKAGALVTKEAMSLYKRGHIMSLGSAENIEEIERGLFKALRKLDYHSIDVAYSVGVDERGAGEAVMNRLFKAAAGRVIAVNRQNEQNK